MKRLITISLSLLSFAAFAAEDLSVMKSRATTHIDGKLSSLHSAKGCIENADTVDKFKACRYDMSEDMRKQKMEEKKEEVKNDEGILKEKMEQGEDKFEDLKDGEKTY